MQRYLISSIAASAFTGSLLSSCGAFSTKKQGEKVEQTNLSLVGEWKNGCTQRSWLSNSVFEQQTRKFGALGDFERSTTLFSEATCSQAEMTVHEQGTYSDLGGSAKIDAHDINFTVTGVSITPRSDNMVEILNKATYCNINSWRKEQAMDVLDHDCIGANHPKGEVIFDIYRLDQDGKRLLTGKSSLFLDKSDAQARPEALDDARAFEKL